MISISRNKVWRHWYQMCFLVLIGLLCIRGMWRKGRSWFHSGKEAGYLLQMCADTPSSCLIRYREAPAFSLSVHLFLSHTLTCPSHFSLMPPLPVLPSIIPQWETLHVHLMSPVFFFFPPPCPKEKDDPDNGNEHTPAVGSDQLTLTSVPDQTTD